LRSRAVNRGFELLSSDVAPYSAFDFAIVSAGDLSALACFTINSHCFRA